MVYVLVSCQKASTYTSILKRVKQRLDEIKAEQSVFNPIKKRPYSNSSQGTCQIKAIKKSLIKPSKKTASHIDSSEDEEPSDYNFELLVDFEAA